MWARANGNPYSHVTIKGVLEACIFVLTRNHQGRVVYTYSLVTTKGDDVAHEPAPSRPSMMTKLELGHRYWTML